MDVVKWGAAGILAVAFVGALLVREQPAGAVALLPLPAACGAMTGEHGGVSMQGHLDMMAADADAGHAALIQTMEPMHSDMMPASPRAPVIALTGRRARQRECRFPDRR